MTSEVTTLWDVEPVTGELSGEVRPKCADENRGHVMAAKVERDEELENARMLWIYQGEITE